MSVAGVDEAGRGCAIGPLVVAGASFYPSDVETLRDMGVRDSKKLTPKRREALSKQIKEIAARIEFFEIQPRSIDAVVNRGVKLRRLNYLEATAMAHVLWKLSPSEAYVDAADTDASRFGEFISRLLPGRTRVISEHKADDTYPVCSAASILAKVRRDALVAQIREHAGDFGSGYMTDERTTTWLESWFSGRKECPPFVRSSWKPVREIRARLAQGSLASASA